MTTFAWPLDLPQVFLRSGYQEQLVPNLLRDNFDTGPASLRRRATDQPFGVKGRMVMTHDQWDSLIEFIENDLADRLFAFSFPIQGVGTGDWLVRMVNPPTRTNLREGYWMVSLDLEVLHTTGLIVPVVLPSVSFLQVTDDISDLTTYTFAGQNLGAAAAGRLIVVAIHTDSAASLVNSCTVQGISATQAALVHQTAALAALFYAVVPTGTTGDVVFTLNAGAPRASIALYRIVDLASPTPVDTAQHGAVAGVHTGTVDIPASGVAIAALSLNTINLASTWAGATEQYDQNIGAEAGTRISGAFTQPLVESLGSVISSTHTSDQGAFVAGVWR